MTEAKSAQPQLLPLDEKCKEEKRRLPESAPYGSFLECELSCRERQLLSALAENESLKAQRATDAQIIDRYAKENLELIGERDRAEAERDKLLEVVREYRKGGKHQGCNDLIEWQFDGKDHRCPTCIKADALFLKEPKEEKE